MAAVRPLFLLLFFFFLFPLRSLSLDSDNQALLALKQSFTHSDALTSWLPNSSPCSAKWFGVICFDGSITGLHLTGLALSGNIDVNALAQLRGLRTISFVNNSFTGQIPQFHTLGALKSLLLTGNQFSGQIPADYFSNLTSLKKVWLSYNQFTGTIPESVTHLSHLIELHFEHNKLTGRIPPMKQTSLKQLDLSHNMLEGEIPQSLSIFDQNSFKGNEGLCGKPLLKVCTENDNETALTPMPADDDDNNKNDHKNDTALVLLFFAIVAFLFMFFACGTCSKRRDDEFSVLGREKMADDPVVQVHVPSSNRSRATADYSSRKGDSKKGSTNNNGKSGISDLIMVNNDRGAFGLPDLMKAAAEVLGNGGLGSAYRATMANGLSVVVKRMREMNRLQKDGFDEQMMWFGRLRHRNILTPLAYHFRREEKLLVSEYIPKGSLLYLLHGDRGISHAELNWPTRLKIIKGIARGMGFLHTEFACYDVPHGNLKSSNVLLGEDYEPLLSDYAFNPLINTTQAMQALFAYKSPEYAKYQQLSPKSDVYCLGIIILEILSGKFPSQYHNNGKGGIDVVQWVLTAMSENREEEVIDPEMASSTNSVKQMLQLLQIGAACIESNPEQRLDMREAIRRIEGAQV
ncbi:pollen receptor-like kinase 3 [Corylus avellana]|uniref:pollen receptor-like kinase 3 n=1 Tax=Corylus avellana TaxID=13451 RepID=UPI00286B4CCE|nr:pollen receptor-like kinase 3 [Corylus avellana]